MRRSRAIGVVVALVLAACGGGGGGGPATVVTPPTPQGLDVTPCLTQLVAGRSLASLVVPDVVTLDMNQPNGFPNGRRLDDPVIDLELAALFLDLRQHPVDILARRPLNPGGNDKVTLTVFPYLAEAHGGAPAAVGGSGFVFRTDAPSAYTRVDRGGEPAVSTVLVSGPFKNAFNDGTPAADANGMWVAEFTATLTVLATQFRDDFMALGLTPCAVPRT